jgi:hypothetical protein
MAKNRNTVEIYRGPSRIDGAQIVVLLSGLKAKADNANRKTGAMLQTYILRADMDPTSAVMAGADASICGGCTHRRRFDSERGKDVRTCYVNLGHGPRSVHLSWSRGNIASVELASAAELARDRMVRLGTYGDPAAVPADIWRGLLAYASGWTGYTHQAASPKFRDVLEWCQVSADILADAESARAAGVGSFRVLAIGEDPAPFETLCPSLSGVQCIDCGACSGFAGESIAIPAHGPSARAFDPSRIQRRGLSLPVLNPARAALMA